MKLIGEGHTKDGDVKPHEIAGAIYYKGEPMDMIKLEGSVHSYKDNFGNLKIVLDTKTGYYNIYKREAEDGEK